ncbi:MAG TPA: bifunctional DNA-formamidopyrimidine glycosylase/DNA-(apurinic or apyrimidinic site) lyase [Alphaproteobacteria bacterium]|nr:bifunctional DNA-formamidopyrimidine glycosylase/DNA-(apurinic or apyrimidinic site) lyase [Alphaproteobacteria bacterium]
MPELPEVETVRRGLTAVMEGRRIMAVDVRRRDLRIPVPENFADALVGRTVVRLGRRGKYLVFELDDGMVLLAHLGMSGRMLIDRPETGEPGVIDRHAHTTGAGSTHEHIVFEVGNGTLIRFRDPRRFGLMTLTRKEDLATHKLLAELGPEPTGAAFTGAVLSAALAGKKTPIKAALLDQRIVAGLGNIYVCESLFQAGISPRRMASSVQGKRAVRLVEAIHSVLDEAIEAGGSTLRDHVAPDGEIGYFQHSFQVYDREGVPCPGCTCGGVVRRIVQSGRSTFYCPRRQH